MHQECPLHQTHNQTPKILINNTAINSVEKFKYLGSVVCNNLSLDAEVSLRIANASAAFGKLTKRLWNDNGIRLTT